jgi:hypothetical protein
VRKFLLQAVRGFQAGEDPPGLVYEAGQNYFPDLRSEIALLPRSVSWKTLWSREPRIDSKSLVEI